MVCKIKPVPTKSDCHSDMKELFNLDDLWVFGSVHFHKPHVSLYLTFGKADIVTYS